jgi:hypothetical protein
MICWNIIMTTLNMSSTDETVYVRNLNWLTWYLLLVVPQERWGTHFSHCGGAGLCNWRWLRLLRSTAMKDNSGVVWLEENTPPIVVSSSLWNFLFRISWRACSLDSWRYEVPQCPPIYSCSMMVSMPYCPFLDTPCAADCPHTTYNREVACS